MKRRPNPSPFRHNLFSTKHDAAQISGKKWAKFSFELFWSACCCSYAVALVAQITSRRLGWLGLMCYCVLCCVVLDSSADDGNKKKSRRRGRRRRLCLRGDVGWDCAQVLAVQSTLSDLIIVKYRLMHVYSVYFNTRPNNKSPAASRSADIAFILNLLPRTDLICMFWLD